ncbi:MAG: hypothetical protein P8K69_00145 [Flavobacteriales bacterium]|nr:hypothetical protein [Flavobacteriales bacterium]
MKSLFTYLLSRKIFLLIILYSNLLLAQCEFVNNNSASVTGPYNVESISEGDGMRNGPDYSGATLFYPENAEPPFASIVIVPGYATLESSIQNWGPFFASHGIVTMTIGTNSVFEQPEDRKDALLDALETMRHENTRINSPMYNSIDTNRFALGGWSMGGGGAQLAAVEDPSLKAVIAMCPWLNTLTLSSSDLNHSSPVLIFSGQIDAISPPGVHANVHYNFTPQSTDKLIYEIEFASHLVANGPEGGDGEVGRIALSWLKKYLVEDECYCPLLLDTPNNASYYMTNVECEELSSQSIDFNSGWSMVSSHITPLNTDFASLTAPIIESMIIAKDNLGAAYLPNWDFNGIGDWEDGQGYLVKMTTNELLIIEGTQLIPEENPISLNQGWNTIAYFPLEPIDAEIVFSELTENNNLVIAKDYIGNAFLPEWEFNGIGDLETGKGYQLKVNSSSILQY